MRRAIHTNIRVIDRIPNLSIFFGLFFSFVCLFDELRFVYSLSVVSRSQINIIQSHSRLLEKS